MQLRCWLRHNLLTLRCVSCDGEAVFNISWSPWEFYSNSNFVWVIDNGRRIAYGNKRLKWLICVWINSALRILTWPSVFELKDVDGRTQAASNPKTNLGKWKRFILNPFKVIYDEKSIKAWRMLRGSLFFNVLDVKKGL